MKTKKEKSTNIFSQIPFVLGMKSPMRYAAESLGTPYEQIGKDPEVKVCYVEDIAGKIFFSYSMNCLYKFHNNNKLYVRDSKVELEKYKNWIDDNDTNNLIENSGVDVQALVEQMEEKQEQILCLSKASVDLTCLLIEARTNSILYNKYWDKLPNGKTLKREVDETFERLCSKARIPRRTRIGIENKKLKTISVEQTLEIQESEIIENEN